ncbi:MAG: hypothetical protein IT445_17575 [Phycisphaeraceae bacterium]|nr:hypothetical protein [Phycisphaeraceae bacterium]
MATQSERAVGMDDLPVRFQSLIQDHKQWLSCWPDRSTKWCQLLADAPEAALAEAWVCQQLKPKLHRIEPNDAPQTGGLDFKCVPSIDSNDFFFVEVTNLESGPLTNKSGLPARVEDWKGGGVCSIHNAFRRKRHEKQDQIRSHNIQGQVLIAITAFHETATFIHFDHGNAEQLLIPPDSRCFTYSKIGDPDFRPETWVEPSFQDALFFKPGTASNTYRAACPDLSGVLLCAIPWRDTITGKAEISLILNPTADSRFDPAWLPEIPCCQLQSDWEQVHPCQWTVEWMNVTHPVEQK